MNIELSLDNLIEVASIYRLLLPYPTLVDFFNTILNIKQEEIEELEAGLFSSDSETEDETIWIEGSSDLEFEEEAMAYQND
tara:strand:+ start:14655 stop:14897 length:243 start_codon:yes stop_codon:yes gene_type:complete